MRILSPRLSCVSASSGRPFALHFTDGTVEHLGIKFETDGFDVPALLAAQKIACATQLEIERGDFEPCSEIRKFFQRRQPATCDGSEFGFSRHQQVGIGAAVRAAHAAAQLVKLREAQTVGAIDEDGVAQRECRGHFR